LIILQPNHITPEEYELSEKTHLMTSIHRHDWFALTCNNQANHNRNLIVKNGQILGKNKYAITGLPCDFL